MGELLLGLVVCAVLIPPYLAIGLGKIFCKLIWRLRK